MTFTKTLILLFLALIALVAAPALAAPNIPATVVAPAPAPQPPPPPPPFPQLPPGAVMQIQNNAQGGAGVSIQVTTQGGGGQSVTVIQQGGQPPVMMINGQPVSTAPAPASATAARAPAVPVDQRDLPALVADLGNENWAARQHAEDRLTAAGPDILPRLDPFLAKTADAETLWRLERIYHALTPPNLYAADGPTAYMGVGFTMVSSGVDARLTGRQWGMQINLVQPGTPAEQAGLAPNDLIVSLNGEPFVGSYTDGATNQSVTERIQSCGVGADVKVVYFRGQDRHETTVKLAPRTDGAPPTLPVAQKWKHYWNTHLSELRPAAAKPAVPIK